MEKKKSITLHKVIVQPLIMGYMKIQIRDKDFNLLAERERSTKSKTPTTFIHKLRRIGDKPALKPFVGEFAL